MPSCRAARILAWPAFRPPSAPTSAGVVQPHSLMLAGIAATWASEWVRAFFAYGISRSIAHRSTLSAGHGLDPPGPGVRRATGGSPGAFRCHAGRCGPADQDIAVPARHYRGADAAVVSLHPGDARQC